MTKKQYFMFLLLLGSMYEIYSIVLYGLNQPGLLIHHPLVQIIMYGVVIFFGMNFAQKIGAHLLFLDGNYNFFEDIVKPAVVVGCLYAGGALIINSVVPIFSVTSFFDASDSFYELFEWFLNRLFLYIRMDLSLLLFGISGLTLLITRLAKNITVATAFAISVAMVMLLVHVPALFDWYILSHHSGSKIIIYTLWPITTSVLLSTLFWKKGLETALLCHVVIVTILYLIAPAIVCAAGA